MLKRFVCFRCQTCATIDVWGFEEPPCPTCRCPRGSYPKGFITPKTSEEWQGALTLVRVGVRALQGKSEHFKSILSVINEPGVRAYVARNPSLMKTIEKLESAND
jgi:hypothetical protein